MLSFGLAFGVGAFPLGAVLAAKAVVGVGADLVGAVGPVFVVGADGAIVVGAISLKLFVDSRSALLLLSALSTAGFARLSALAAS